MSEKWLEELQVGDRVHVATRGAISNAGTVVRLTKTQIIVDKGGAVPTKFNRTTGREVGGDTWGVRRIQPYSEEIEQVRQVENERILTYRRLQRSFESSRSSLPLEALREIEGIVKRYQEAPEDS